MKSFIRPLIGILLVFAAMPAPAGVGDLLPPLELKDAQDRPQRLDDTVRRIYATSDRKSGALMETAMTGLDQSQLDAQRAVVIAEISAAPFFVKSIIRGSLRDLRYSTWLDARGLTRSLLPYRPDQVTVIELEQRRIKAVRHVGDADRLRQELAPAPSPEQTEEKK